MPHAPIPDNEEARLAELYSLHLLDSPAEERLDRLTRMACKLLRAPFSMLTLVDRNRQWFKSAQGHLIAETPRTDSFCAFTILEDRPLLVVDATVDPRFFDHSVVAGPPGVRFYAGIPLRGPAGGNLGTLCVLDMQPRQLDPEDLASLQDLAACAESELQRCALSQNEQAMLKEADESRRKAALDPTTRCWNLETFLSLLEKESPADGISLVVLHLNGIEEINARQGLASGDQWLRRTADFLRSDLTSMELLGRGLGSRFLLLTRHPLGALEGLAQDWLQQLVAYADSISGQGDFLFSFGIASRRGSTETSQELLERATRAQMAARAKNTHAFLLAV